MTRIAVFARLVAKAGREEELIASLERVVDLARSQQGTLVFAMHPADDPRVIWFYELHADAAALAEQDEAAGRLLGSGLEALIDVPAEILISRVVDAVGLPEDGTDKPGVVDGR